MEENQTGSSVSGKNEINQNTSKKNLGVIISFIVVLLVISVVLIARLHPHASQNQQQAINQTKAMTPVANNMSTSTTPTPNSDVSNTKLDQDLQNAQGNLNGLDTNLNTAGQSINNQSADILQ